ncbi:hypothetical protein D3C72_2572340 [compost metagenome]
MAGPRAVRRMGMGERMPERRPKSWIMGIPAKAFGWVRAMQRLICASPTQGSMKTMTTAILSRAKSKV